MTDTRFALRGAICELNTPTRAKLRDRGFTADPALSERVRAILGRVRNEKDRALRAMSLEFDGVVLDDLEVPRASCVRALDRLDPTLRRVMQRAADNISRVHQAIPLTAIEVEPERGIIIGRRPDPLRCVGVYAPGGRAAYPSSVLMGGIPARVAGVREIVLCSPPLRESCRPSDMILAAAVLAGVDRVFAVGGAGAIGAMAFGTESVPQVDRIVGPGNAYVAEAKLQVANVVATDAPAGPSELLVIADGSADPDFVAREMLAQAEHDPDACIVCVVLDGSLVDRVERTLQRRLIDQPRATIMTTALGSRGALLSARSIDEALQFVDDYAPEHLLLAVADPESLLPRVRNVGTVFLGGTASVTFGDYMTGANHVLPTGGLARSYSGLSTHDFVRWTTYQRVSPTAAARLAGDVAVLAAAEGLTGHADAARAWNNAAEPTEVLT